MIQIGKDPDPDPDPDAVYLYNCQQAWRDGAAAIDVRRGEQKAHKVRRSNRAGLEFEFTDEPGVTYSCNYGWAFVLDTPENAAWLASYYDWQEWMKRADLALRSQLSIVSLAVD